MSARRWMRRSSPDSRRTNPSSTRTTSTRRSDSVDHFGNASLNIARADLEAAGMNLGDTVEIRCNGRTLTVPFTPTFGEVAPGELTLCEDSFHAVQLAVNAGRASQELRVNRGDPIVIARMPQQPVGGRPAVTI